MGATAPKIKDKVWATINKARDLQLRIKHTQVAGEEEVVQIRDYIPSRSKDGHGATFPIHLLPEVIENLTSLQQHLGVAHARIDPGDKQGKLAV